MNPIPAAPRIDLDLILEASEAVDRLPAWTLPRLVIPPVADRAAGRAPDLYVETRNPKLSEPVRTWVWSGTTAAQILSYVDCEHGIELRSAAALAGMGAARN